MLLASLNYFSVPGSLFSSQSLKFIMKYNLFSEGVPGVLVDSWTYKDLTRNQKSDNKDTNHKAEDGVDEAHEQVGDRQPGEVLLLVGHPGHPPSLQGSHFFIAVKNILKLYFQFYC